MAEAAATSLAECINRISPPLEEWSRAPYQRTVHRDAAPGRPIGKGVNRHALTWIDESISSPVSIDIPVGTAFQYRCTGAEALRCLCITMPPWPGNAGNHYRRSVGADSTSRPGVFRHRVIFAEVDP